jgi:hypothetical protein
LSPSDNCLSCTQTRERLVRLALVGMNL